MAIVTLTGHMGALGDVAEMVARSLHYRLADRELVMRAALSLGWTEADVAQFDECTGGLSRRLLEFLERSGRGQLTTTEYAGMFAPPTAESIGETLVPSDRYVEALRTTMQELAAEGDVVLVGRGGQAILRGRPDAVHLRLACPQEERILRTARRLGIDLSEAAARVQDSDHQREAWHRKSFGIDYQSPYHYALVLNTAAMSDAFAARLISETVLGNARRDATDGQGERFDVRAPVASGGMT